LHTLGDIIDIWRPVLNYPHDAVRATACGDHPSLSSATASMRQLRGFSLTSQLCRSLQALQNKMSRFLFPGRGEVERGQPASGIMRTELVSTSLAVKAPLGVQRGREGSYPRRWGLIVERSMMRQQARTLSRAKQKQGGASRAFPQQ
jgi:hypothetical protein